MSPTPTHNLAARMARWSGQHRKKAILGWLAFVLIASRSGATWSARRRSRTSISTRVSRTEAEVALDRAGLRPVEEVVFIQSDKLTVKDPAFRAAVEDVTDRLSGIPYVENVSRRCTGDSEVSADGHAALVGFEIARRLDRGAADRVDPSLAAVAAVQDEPSRPRHRAVRRRQRRQGHQRGDHRRPRARPGVLSLPVTLIILTITFGTLVAAGLPLLIGITSVMAALGPGRDPERPVPAGRRQPPRGRPADRPGGRGRLLALLPPARA